MVYHRDGLGIAVAAVCALLVLPLCNASAETSYLKAKDEIAMVGDSVLSSGVNMEQMQQVIDAIYPGAGIKVLNYGSGGKSSGSGITFMEGYRGKRIACIMYGINDLGWSWGGLEEKTKKFIGNLSRIVEMAKAKNGQLIFLRETHLTRDATPDEWALKLSGALEHLLRAQDVLAAEHNIPVVDVKGMYCEAQAESWYKDIRWFFAPDGVHPSSPGQAAIAAAMLRAFGVGLPLAGDERGPLQITGRAPIKMRAADAVGIVKDDGTIAVKVFCRSLSGAPLKGELTVVAAGYAVTQAVSIAPYGGQEITAEIPAAKLEGRWACVPLYMAFKGDAGFASDHTLFCFSRVFNTAQKPHVVTAKDFVDGYARPREGCMVSRVEASCSADGITFEFQWPDDTVPAVPDKPAPFTRKGQRCDALEFIIDLRPHESTGRYTCGGRAMPEGVHRLGVFKTMTDGKLVAKLVAISEDADKEATLADKGDGTYVLTLKNKIPGPSIAFSMRATNADAGGPGKSQTLFLTIKKDLVQEPVTFIRLSAGESGVFYRVGY